MMTTAARIAFAQDFFRFAYRVGGPISFGLEVQLPPMPEVMSFGKFTLAAEDFEMPDEVFELCGTLLERLAYRLLAMELNTALEKTFGPWRERCRHENEFIRNSSIVVWLIRNAVAHDILEPVWKIDNNALQDREFLIEGINDLQHYRVKRQAFETLGFRRANHSFQAKAYRNIPSGEPDESLVEVIQVLDPRHPLYGRAFRVICRSSHRGGNFPPSYEVEHRGGTSLLVPISATEPFGLNANRTKLSIEALCELISAAECLKCDEHRSERSLGDTVAGSTAPDRQRHRRGSGGDVS